MEDLSRFYTKAQAQADRDAWERFAETLAADFGRARLTNREAEDAYFLRQLGIATFETVDGASAERAIEAAEGEK